MPHVNSLDIISFFIKYFRMNKKLVSFFASSGLLFTAAIWGFSFVVVKDSLDYMGAMYMIACRYTIAAALMSLIFIKKWRLLNRDYIIHGTLTGAFLFLAYLTQTVGCRYTTAGKNAFLTTVYVILIPFITWILTKKRPGIFVFIAAVMSLTGIGFLALGSEKVSGVNIGDVLTLICGIFFALHIIFTERFNSKGGDPLFITLLQFVFTAAAGWIFTALFEPSFSLQKTFSSNVLFSILYLGIFSTMIGFSLQNLGLKYVKSSSASLFLSFESVFGILFSTIFLHEELTLLMIFGCVLIFAAVVIAENTK